MTPSTKSQTNIEGPKQEEMSIEQEMERLKTQLGGEDPNKIINRHIKLLHEYNESKDAAQALMGKLALLRGGTVRQLHEQYGLSSGD